MMLVSGERSRLLSVVSGTSGDLNCTLRLGLSFERRHHLRHVDAALTLDQPLRDEKTTIYIASIGHQGGVAAIEGLELPVAINLLEGAG